MRHNSSNKPGVIRHDSFFKQIPRGKNEWKTKPIVRWERKDTIFWVLYTIIKGGIDEEHVNMEGFLLSGKRILAMTEVNFQKIDLQYGNYIWKQFNAYKRYSPEPTKGKENNPGKIKKRSPSRPRLLNPIQRPQKSPRIWEFIRDLLLNPETCPSLIKWLDYDSRIFKFVKPNVVAAMWGERNSNRDEENEMTYQNFARAIRYYYDKGICKSVDGRYIYAFGENAVGLETSNPNFLNKTNSEEIFDGFLQI